MFVESKTRTKEVFGSRRRQDFKDETEE